MIRTCARHFSMPLTFLMSMVMLTSKGSIEPGWMQRSIPFIKRGRTPCLSTTLLITPTCLILLLLVITTTTLLHLTPLLSYPHKILLSSKVYNSADVCTCAHMMLSGEVVPHVVPTLLLPAMHSRHPRHLSNPQDGIAISSFHPHVPAVDWITSWLTPYGI